MRGRVITVSLPEFSKTFKNREEYLKFERNKK